ncbi:hypothetical protein E4U19_007767 [Claviceps sp. Clav32 group G5]|nr:hypothetical protein E4U19_007767 [Claviceps sp. Clav32 group G5]KAG6041074.1 hypothetical protein E4U39_006733 [Claviceps sp. Clav50 group G5]
MIKLNHATGIDILDASGTEWREEAKCFSLSDVQRAGFIEKCDTRAGKIIDSSLPKNDYITIDTYAHISSDEPDAGRTIHPATSKVMRGGRNPSTESETPLDATMPGPAT